MIRLLHVSQRLIDSNASRLTCLSFNLIHSFVRKNEDNGLIQLDSFDAKAERRNLTDHLINEAARTIRGKWKIVLRLKHPNEYLGWAWLVNQFMLQEIQI